MNISTNSPKEKLSLLWLMVAFNILLADILSLYVATVDQNVIDLQGNVKTLMAVAAILVNIPIFMVFLSRNVDRKRSRLLNIIAAVVTMLFVVGGGSSLPHYIVIETIEVLLLLYIISVSWRWKSDN